MRILFITQFLPYPLDNGGAIKTFQTLKLLAKKHQIYLFCFLESEAGKEDQKILAKRLGIEVESVVSRLPLAEFREIRKDILKSVFSPLPFIVYRYRNEKLARLIKERVEKGIDAVHIDHLNVASYLSLTKKTHIRVLEEHNIESELNWRIVKKESLNKFKFFSFLEMIKMFFYERLMIPRFDYWLAISQVDGKKLVKLGVKKEKTFFLPTVFKPNPLFSFKKGRFNIYFVGDLVWWPNKDGILWFMKEVFPLIKEKVPEVRLFLIGRRIDREIVKLASSEKQIKLLGYVENLEKHLKDASCFVIPLRGGSGIRIKTLGAMSMGIPVVSTTLGAEGIEVKDGKEIVLADNPRDFAQAVVSVFKNQSLAKKLSKAAIEFIKKNYNEEKAKEVLDRVYGDHAIGQLGSRSRINLAGLPVDRISLKTIVPTLKKLAESVKNRPYFVTYLNAHCANLAFKNKSYRQILRKADLVYADGFGIVLAARRFGYQLPGRLTGKDFFDEFCQMAEKEKLSLFFLGGEDKVVRKMIKILKKKFPQIEIKGWQNGYFDKKEEKLILARINRLKPDFLIVGLGSPKQELWLVKNISQLKIKVGWCVGGLFDFVSGEKPRCPKWLGDLGFEWLFRLLTEPRRLGKRYLFELPAFCYTVLRKAKFNPKIK